jgi:hypothetical protein
MVLSPQEKAVVVNLINVAWATGSVKSPQDAQVLEDLRAKLSAKSESTELKKVE